MENDGEGGRGRNGAKYREVWGRGEGGGCRDNVDMKWAFHVPVIATVMHRGGHTCTCVCYTNNTCAGAHTFIMPSTSWQ